MTSLFLPRCNNKKCCLSLRQHWFQSDFWSIEILGHWTAGTDHPCSPKKSCKEARPDTVGLLWNDHVQSIGNGHTYEEWQNCNCIDVDSVSREICWCCDSVEYIYADYEEDPEKEEAEDLAVTISAEIEADRALQRRRLSDDPVQAGILDGPHSQGNSIKRYQKVRPRP